MVFEFHGVNADRIAILDAVFLEELIELHIAPNALETTQGLVVVEVGHGNQIFNAGAGDDESPVRIAGHFKVRLILSLIDDFFRSFVGFFDVFFKEGPDPL